MWRQRRRRLVRAAAFSFLAAFSPALTKLLSFVKRIAMVSVHSGYYGSGSVRVVDVDHDVPGLLPPRPPRSSWNRSDNQARRASTACGQAGSLLGNRSEPPPDVSVL